MKKKEKKKEKEKRRRKKKDRLCWHVTFKVRDFAVTLLITCIVYTAYCIKKRTRRHGYLFPILLTKTTRIFISYLLTDDEFVLQWRLITRRLGGSQNRFY